jgi:hypothetical protein
MEANIEQLLAVLSADTTVQPSPLLTAVAIPELDDTLLVLPRAKHTGFAEALSKQIRALPPDGADAQRRAAASIILLFLRDKKSPTPPELLAAAKALHDNLPLVRLSAAQNAIVRMCECFWADYRESRELLVPNALAFLLRKSLALDDDTRGASASDVKRVYGFRDALESSLATWSDQTRQMLLQTVLSALYMRVPEGQRFLARLLASHLDGVHAAFLHMLPNVRKSRANACGAVYVHAWKEMGTESFSPILEDVLNKAIRAGTDPLASNLRTLLASFHANKRVNGMDEMLHTVYTPILFRALTVANPLVRRNAVTILADSFPIHDPSMSIVDLESTLDDQCQKVSMLLEDPVPLVRVAATEGICRVLGLLWEIVPSGTARRIIDLLSGTLIFDKTSAPVRAAVCEGLRFMLDNHLTHPILSVALPRLKNIVHDRVERVRIAFLDLLLELKGKRIASARFFDIVPIHELLLRLSVDTPAVSNRIMQLLVSSYFPLERRSKTRDQIAASQVRACIDILKQGENTSNRFYGALSMYVPPGALVEFCIRLAALAMEQTSVNSPLPVDHNSAANKKQGPRREPKRKSIIPKPIDPDVENIPPTFPAMRARLNLNTENAELTGEDLKCRLLGVIAIVMTSIAPSLQKSSNVDLQKCIVEVFGGGSLKTLIISRGNSISVRLSCLRIAANIPSPNVLPILTTWRNELEGILAILSTGQRLDDRWLHGLIYSGLRWRMTDVITEVAASWADIAISGHRSAVLGAQLSKRSRRSAPADHESDKSLRLAAVIALAKICDNIADNDDLRTIFMDIMMGEPCSSDEQSRQSVQKDKVPWHSASSSASDFLTMVKRGVIGSMDLYLENENIWGERPMSQTTLLTGLSSFLKLSLCVSVYLRPARAIEQSVQRPDPNPRQFLLVDCLEWASAPDTISAVFQMGPDFALAFCNIIMTHATDAAALGSLDPSTDFDKLSTFAGRVASRFESVSAASTLQIRDSLLRFSLAVLSAAYHVLCSTEVISTSQDLGDSGSRSGSKSAETGLHGKILFSYATDVLSKFSMAVDNRHEAALSNGAARFGEFILAFFNLGDFNSHFVDFSSSITGPLCSSAVNSEVGSTSPALLALFCLSLVQLGGKSKNEVPGCEIAEFVRALTSTLVLTSQTAAALVLEQLSDFILQEDNCSPTGALTSLCDAIRHSLTDLENRSEGSTDATKAAIAKAKIRVDELRQPEVCQAEGRPGVEAVCRPRPSVEPA